jgi:hypothetical protein
MQLKYIQMAPLILFCRWRLLLLLSWHKPINSTEARLPSAGPCVAILFGVATPSQEKNLVSFLFQEEMQFAAEVVMVEGGISDFLDLFPCGSTLSGSKDPFTVHVSRMKKCEEVLSINWMGMKLA